MEKVVFNYSITPAWEVVRTIEGKIKKIFKTDDSELFNATIMVVSELIENAVKYGQALPTADSIKFNFSADDKSIIIKVLNPVYDITHFEEFKEHIKKIQDSDNPQELYIQRLQELLEYKHITKSQLGLYRIAYEGKFKLSYDYDNNILTVTAIRKVD